MIEPTLRCLWSSASCLALEACRCTRRAHLCSCESFRCCTAAGVTAHLPPPLLLHVCFTLLVTQVWLWKLCLICAGLRAWRCLDHMQAIIAKSNVAYSL